MKKALDSNNKLWDNASSMKDLALNRWYHVRLKGGCDFGV
jgi:hypothetical protein